MKKHMVVIGGGITGVTSAYALAQQGFEVTLVEKSPTAHREAETAKAHRG